MLMLAARGINGETRSFRDARSRRNEEGERPRAKHNRRDAWRNVSRIRTPHSMGHHYDHQRKRHTAGTKREG